jgi:hypothetical protein
MIGELSLYGIYFPALLVPMVLAFVLLTWLRALLTRIGFYRLVWHRSLFNFSLYVIVLGGMVLLTNR